VARAGGPANRPAAHATHERMFIHFISATVLDAGARNLTPWSLPIHEVARMSKPERCGKSLISASNRSTHSPKGSGERSFEHQLAFNGETWLAPRRLKQSLD
jgi:hypothetical protein